MQVRQTGEKKRTILLVDDDAVYREYVSGILRRSEYRVVECSDPGEASLVMRKGFPIDLVITDFCMPGRNGLEFADEVRKRCPGTPIIMITGHAAVETYFQAFALGVVDYINKPVDEPELLRTVSVALAKAGQRTRHGMQAVDPTVKAQGG